MRGFLPPGVGQELAPQFQARARWFPGRALRRAWPCSEAVALGPRVKAADSFLAAALSFSNTVQPESRAKLCADGF